MVTQLTTEEDIIMPHEHIELSEEEAIALNALFTEFGKAGREMVESLERIHERLDDTITCLRIARGAAEPRNA